MFLKITELVLRIVNGFLELEREPNFERRKIRTARLKTKLTWKRAKAFRFLTRLLKKKRISADAYTVLYDALLSTF